MAIEKLINLAIVIAGQSPKSEYYSESVGTPFLQGNRTFGQVHPLIDTYTTKVTKLAEPNDILMSVRAPVGDLNVADREICLGRGLAAIRPKSISYKFIYFALHNGISNLLQKGSGTTFDSVDKELVENLEIQVPEDRDSWELIGDFLWLIEEQVMNHNEIIETNLNFSKHLFERWFIQYDFPIGEKVGYRSSGGKLKRSDFFASEFPENWHLDKLNQEIKIGSGFPFNSDNYSPEGRYSVITIRNVQDGYLNLDSQNRIDIDKSTLPKHCVLSRGDILVSLTGNVGRVAIVDSEGHVLNQRVGVILADSHWKNFAYLYLLLPEVRQRLINIANGSSQDNLSPLDIFNDHFPIPPVDILEEFNLIVGPVIDMITESQIEITKLKEIQKWALPLLMSDQLLFSKLA